MFKRLLDRLLLWVGLSRASVTRYYAGSAAHNQKALEARILELHETQNAFDHVQRLAYSRWLAINRLHEEKRELTDLYMKQCDNQALLAVEKVVASCVGAHNQELMKALTSSRGAQWVGAEMPEVNEPGS